MIFQLQCRTIHSEIKEACKEIYIPNGIANNYTDLLTFSIDEHKIWEYRLSDREKENAESNLNNSVWNKVTNESTEETEYFFTVNSDSFLPKDISNDSYYCIYDFSLRRFIGADEDVALLGWRRALFVYDNENAHYYCVIKSI